MAGNVGLASAADVNALRTQLENLAASETRGRAVFNGDGTATTFVIPHLLPSTPGAVQITPGSVAAAKTLYATASSQNITVTFTSPPASGTGNVILYWLAGL